MSMIYAGEPLFKDLFPNGCIVHDRLGRRLTNVIACNPKTGEVIAYDDSWLTGQWMRLLFMSTPVALRLRLRGAKLFWQQGLNCSSDCYLLRRGVKIPLQIKYFHCSGDGYLLRRHGFWPAPLTITPKP